MTGAVGLRGMAAKRTGGRFGANRDIQNRYSTDPEWEGTNGESQDISGGRGAMMSSGGALLKSCYKESAYHCYGGFRLRNC